jgi:putative transposase
MPRRLRLEFDGAIYHVMARGNARQEIVRDDTDRTRLLEDLQRATIRSGWEVFAFVLMSNHLHVFLKTPRANLGRGMQRFLSSYAHWCLRRRRRAGHLFQGRYKADLIEDEAYYWTVSRYIHLNPVRARLVAHPSDWAWSSYPGYASRKFRRPWVAHEALLNAWGGEYGGKNPAAAYRRFVEAGIAQPPASPFREAFGGWVLGSERFVARLRGLSVPAADPPTPEARQLSGLDAEVVCAIVTEYFGLEPSALRRWHDRGMIDLRSMAAWLCRRYSEAPLRELALRFGLSRADSVPNLTRRFEAALSRSQTDSADLEEITHRIATRAKTGYQSPRYTPFPE